MRKLILASATVFVLITAQAQKVETNFDSVRIDTSYVNVFKGAEKSNYKIDYYHSEGYSSKDRFSYEIIVLDSLMILNFWSPSNDDWNYINYQKQIVMDDSTLETVRYVIQKSKVGQKRKGIPLPPATGYTADRLFIETKELNIAGGTVFIGINSDETKQQYNFRIQKEKEISSTLSGQYEIVFRKLRSLFKELPFLLKDMEQ
ncbi:MAG: hypothetical protein QM764_13400 [Chitinophagaceae bacterium]